MSEELNGKSLDGGYVNHALSGSGLDLAHSNGSANSYDRVHRDIHGSSDFVCEYYLSLFFFIFLFK